MAGDAASEVSAYLQKLAGDLKAKNLQAFADSVWFKNDAQKKAFIQYMPVNAAGIDLDLACKEQFDKTYDEIEREVKGASADQALPEALTG